MKPLSGHVLNAVGLSGPGAAALFRDGRWQRRADPFMLSFMAVESKPAVRRAEVQAFCGLFLERMADRRSPVAVQINFACPNTDHPPAELYEEVEAFLDEAAEMDVPLVANFNPLVPVEVLRTAAAHDACDALWIANTVPWGSPEVDWRGIFGTDVSPLAEFGGGGLSGSACLGLTAKKVYEARRAGITKPIVAGNGVQSRAGVGILRAEGADGIAIGVAPMVRPWRSRGMIAEVRWS